MPSESFVRHGFEPPTPLVTEGFRLEPLGPEHNEADHAAWSSSIDHVRATPGYPDGSWPPRDGMSLDANLADLRRHADDFTELDQPLADAVAAWIDADWPWERVDRCGR